MFLSTIIESRGKVCGEKYVAKVKSLSRILLFATPWTVTYQAPPSMGFSRQEYWRGLPCPPPGDLPHPGIEPTSPVDNALPSRFFITSATFSSNTFSIPTNHCLVNICSLFYIFIYSVNFPELSSYGKPSLSKKKTGFLNAFDIQIKFATHKTAHWEFPGGPGVETPCSQSKRPRVQSLVRELDPPCCNKGPAKSSEAKELRLPWWLRR